ncbi:MAG: UvrD-helicase domain-containing protein [Lachnospiraceae bacterium]|nr:UvrD-helicase domain-containing protein [Lachnospiraceae bacterium]
MSIYDSLNPRQKEAVFCTDGPLLLLAGAGSGKTRVLIHRIAYLIEEKKVNPWNIFAITFTNKAAGEMRERVDNMIGYGADKIWVSTFHSACVRILRRDIDKLGYNKNFSIYDTDDQKRTIRDVVKSLMYDKKMFTEKACMNTISTAKEQYMSVADFKEDAKGNFRLEKMATIYEKYQKQLETSNALDFDDILYKTVELFEHHPEVLEYWQERFKYIMVDEYQDTNAVQFLFVKKLASKYKNICVVGDDDQSIYKFRGADIRNILDFNSYFPDATIIKLEQNYRSTSNILNVANSVIRNNSGRMDKTLFTENGEGEKTAFSCYEDNYKEAEGIAKIIKKLSADTSNYSDFAVLNRTNAQSRVFEEKFMEYDIPYKIVGGVSFYARMEIRDIIAYMKLVHNICDDQAMKRIINVPRRGIGLTTIDKLNSYAIENGICLYDAACSVGKISDIKKAAASKILSFVQMIESFRDIAESGKVSELYAKILEETGYVENLTIEGTDEAKDRIRNIEELNSKIVNYEENASESNLDEFLSEVALISEVDSLSSDNAVTVMTIHSAKGLEFENVFLSGLEEGVFPSYIVTEYGDDEEIEEERRLFYVAATRAKKRLFISVAKKRAINGMTQYNDISRFVKEIDSDLLDLAPSFSKTSNISQIRSVNSYSSTAIKPANPMMTYKEAKEENPLEEGLSYKEGDRVRHIKFGLGTVKSITPVENDYEVVVDYDKHGVRRSYASFAKLKLEML